MTFDPLAVDKQYSKKLLLFVKRKQKARNCEEVANYFKNKGDAIQTTGHKTTKTIKYYTINANHNEVSASKKYQYIKCSILVLFL